MSPTQPTEAALETSALEVSAAEALCAALPVSASVTARRFDPAEQPDRASLAGAGDLAAAAFVGRVSADVAVHVDPAVLGDSAALDPTLVSLDDVLRPAFESATGVLGTGVLSTVPTASAHALLQDEETALFQLIAEDRPAGWFAMRLRQSAHGTGSAAGAGSVSGASATGAGPGTGLGTTTTTAPAEAGEDVTSRLSRLNNVQMALTVEIGRTRVSVRDVLAMEPGAVIELDRNAGAPADVRLNGRLIAQGEVVVMDQDYGVRITKILDSAEGLA